MATWRIDSSTDPQGIDDIFAEQGDERINRQKIEQRLKERDALLAAIAYIERSAPNIYADLNMEGLLDKIPLA